MSQLYMVGGSGGGNYYGEGGALEAATALLLDPHNSHHPHLYQHQGAVDKVEGSGVERQGVVRLAPPNAASLAMKLEPDLSDSGSVIKTAPKTSHDPHQNHSPKLELGGPHLELMQPHSGTLQDLQTMRPSYTDPYGSVYGRAYEAAPVGYSSLPAHLLPAHAPAAYGIQEIYYGAGARGPELNYASGMRGNFGSYEEQELLARSAMPPHSSASAALAGLSPVSAAIAGSSGSLIWDPALHYSSPARALAQPTAVSAAHYAKPLPDIPQVSPVDSGIGQDIIVTPSKDASDGFQQYTDMGVVVGGGLGRQQRSTSSVERTISTNRDSPIRIPKLENPLGFQYTLEAPISTSVRKEDDRMTYINKGQFYCVSLDYYHDPEKLLRSGTVRTQMMVVFREEKAEDEELKSWTFWHSRQHSVKQRILDVDTNNSSGIVGKLEEISHNAVQFCWNPMDQSVKINVAVHCLSTDFSNQKGVKGFPLHLQVDTYDDLIDPKTPFHRGYCQVKVFCDKGANRKMLHEARRDEKRRLQGRKKSDAEYHEPCDRSEFYHMSNLHKQAVIFTPPEDYDRNFPAMESFYAMDGSGSSGVDGGGGVEVNGGGSEGGGVGTPPSKRAKLYPLDRVLIYVRQPEEAVFQPLHVHPPSVDGLLAAVQDKYPQLERDKVAGLYKHSRKGMHVKMDDAMVKMYSNEDAYVLQISPSSPAESAAPLFNLTLQEWEGST